MEKQFKTKGGVRAKGWAGYIPTFIDGVGGFVSNDDTPLDPIGPHTDMGGKKRGYQPVFGYDV